MHGVEKMIEAKIPSSILSTANQTTAGSLLHTYRLAHYPSNLHLKEARISPVACEYVSSANLPFPASKLINPSTPPALHR